MARRQTAASSRARQDAHIAAMVARQTPEQRRAEALTWGRWHDHQCIDCQTTYACTAAHGDAREDKPWRCDPCVELKYR